MRGLLKYAFVLALGIAIGAYIVLEPLNEDNAPDAAGRDAAAANSEAALPSTPASIEEEELEYSVAKRLGSLEGWRAFLAAHPNGAHAQSARAEVARQLGAQSASDEGPTPTLALSPTGNEQGHGLTRGLELLASQAQSATAKVERFLRAEKTPASSDPEASVRSPSSEAVPATGAAVSHDASQDARPANGVARHLALAAGADGAASAQLAALAPDEICQRDEDRLAQLRMNPSRGKAERFANELGCEKLRPQVLALFESLSPAPPAADVSGAASPGVQAENETAHLASPVSGADGASPMSVATCERDEERLVRLRSSPAADEALRFEKELGCEKLRPQLHRLMESLDFGPSAPAPADRSHANPLLGEACASERSALDRVRQEPSAEAAGLFWRDMKCDGLRPQVRLLLESLNVAPDPVASAAAASEPKARQAASVAPTAVGADPGACRRETAELNRLRATPDLEDAKRFAGAVTCDALRPQVARLLDSFGE
jgi:hypothetical protein